MALPFWLKKACVRTGIARFTPLAKRLTGGEPRFARYVSDRVLAAPLDELLDPATAPQSSGSDLVNLNLAAPEFELPSILRPSRDATTEDAFGTEELRQIIAEHERRDGRTVDLIEQILITHGARGAYASVLDAFVNPGDRVVLFDPCSPLFHLGAKSRRAALRWVPTWSEDGRARFLSAGFTKAMRGAMLLVLAQPANPTGGRFSTEDLEEIAWLANRNDVLVCVDESFARFQFDPAPPKLSTLPGMDSRTISINSMTAGYGLGSLRLGWLSGHRQLVRTAALCANLNAPAVSPICQHAAATVLKRDRAAFAPMLQQVRDRRQYTFDRLKGLGLEPTWPAAGVTMWVSVASLGIDGRGFAQKLLRDHRVLVGPGCAYGPSGANFVRISYAVEEGRLREGLTRLGRFVAELKNPNPTVVTARVTTGEPALVAETEPSFSRV